MNRWLILSGLALALLGCSQTVERPRAVGLIHDPETRNKEDDERLLKEVIYVADKDGRRDYPLGAGPFYIHYQGQIEDAVALIDDGQDRQAELMLDNIHNQLVKDIEEAKRNQSQYPKQETKHGQ